MPIYEYRCEKCGVVEVMQRITEAPLKRCPNCKGKVERLLSRSSFVLKGSGWYATDYARKGSTAPSESPTSKSSTTAASPEGGSAKSRESSSSTTASSDKPSSKPATG